ncbi:MAG: adenylosuccinate synthetase, partial [Candidatus Cloacimonetes bacterium]|nr:adenylosuccinate synthetase [Candidatus Cloacimonadota bacterium]
GIDEIALTLLDVLSGFESIKICTKYQISDKILGEFPNNINQLSIVKPVYIELPGWKEDISQITDYRHLPENAKKYITRIEVLLKVKISIISVGPERKQVIFN